MLPQGPGIDDVAAFLSAGASELATPIRGSTHANRKAVLLQEMLMAVLPCIHEASNALPNLFGYAADSAKSCKLPDHVPSGDLLPNLRWIPWHVHRAFSFLIPGQVASHL